ncbi:Cysteine-rich receptor protein kinase 25 [Spatholobus suberectus]|nr:Cysteine-rich receptor protein kinase 25 [Spatholobus suberectus]
MASFKRVYLFIFISFINFVTTKAEFVNHSFSDYTCSPSQTTPNSSFQLNMRILLSYLSSNATANKQFYNTTVATRKHSDTVYGMFLCWGDVTPELCSQCVTNATKAIFSDSYPNCSLSIDAQIWYGDCMIRFSNRSFFSIADSTPLFTFCYLWDVSNQTNLMSLFSKTVNKAADETANSPIGAKKYATKEARISGFQTLYCETQCTPDLSPQDCRKCLNVTIMEAQHWCESVPAQMIHTPSCSMECDVYPFYRPSTSPAPTGLILVTNSSNTNSQDPTYLSHNCSRNETMITTGRGFLSNLRTLLSFLASNSTTKTFFKTTVYGRNPSDTVNGLFMCRGELSPTLCQLCVLNATQRISLECRPSKEAIIWYNHCLLRYSSRSSLSTVDTTPTYQDFSIVNTSNPNQQQSFFTWTMANTLLEVEIVTEDNTIKNYGTKAVQLNDHQTLYTLAQCTPDLSNDNCRNCLEKIFKNEIPWCCMINPEGKVLSPSCYMMFGLSQFYKDDDQVEAYRPASSAPTTAGDVLIQAIFACKYHLINQLTKLFNQ